MPEWETVARHEVVDRRPWLRLMNIDLMDLDELPQAVRQGDVAVLSTAAAIGLAIVALSSEEGL